MNKRKISSIARMNILITLSLLGSSIQFIMEVKNTLLFIKNYSTIKSLDFSFYSLTVITTNSIYNITNIPMIIAFIGLLYNTYVLIKNSVKNKKDRVK